MTCHPFDIPGVGRGFVCTSEKRQRCACGQPGTLLCDWKVPSRKIGTCDAPICAACTTSPEPEKDLCPAHAAEFERWKETRRG